MYWRRSHAGRRADMQRIQGNIMYPLQRQLERHDRIGQTGAINNRGTEKMSHPSEQAFHEKKKKKKSHENKRSGISQMLRDIIFTKLQDDITDRLQ